MKKLLAILASVTLVSSSSAVVVSCGTSSAQNSADDYANNNLKDIMEASLQKAKGVIINNEYGIDQNVVRSLQSKKNSNLVQRYYANVRDDNSTLNVKGNSNIDLSGTDGVDDGITYLLRGLFEKLKLNPVIGNFLLSQKDNIVNFIYNITPSMVKMSNLDGYNHSMWNNAVGGTAYPINTLLTAGINYINLQAAKGDKTFTTIVGIINKILSTKDDLANNTVAKFFGAGEGQSTAMNIFRAVLNSAFSKGTIQSKFQDVIYNNDAFVLPNFTPKKDAPSSDTTLADDTTVSYPIEAGASKIADIKFSDIKKEIFASADRILDLVINWKEMGYPADSKTNTFAEDDSYLAKKSDDLSSKLAFLISSLVAKKSVVTNPIDQKAIQGFVVEGFRLMTIFNAAFSMLENTVQNPTNAQHLFSNDQTNYEFLNDPDNDFLNVTLGKSDYVSSADANGNPSEPINLNYFISNLNYYIGGMKDRSDSSYFRIQKLLFLLMNDPSTMKGGTSDTWVDKNSDVIDFIGDLGAKVLKDMFPDDSTPAGKAINGMDIKKAITTAKNLILKPLLLGLLNGDQMGPVIGTLIDTLTSLINNGVIPKDLLDSLKAIGIDINDVIRALNRLADDEEFNQDTFHSLFTNDFRRIIKPLTFIPEKYLDELFGPDLPVNLGTIIDFSVAKILSIFKVEGFVGGKISPIGDWYTTHSVPWLVDTLNKGLNKNNDDILLTKYVVKDKDGNVDLTKSLKAKDINISAIYDLAISIIGKADDQVSKKYTYTKDKYDDQYNIVTKVLDDLVVNDPVKADDKIVPKVQLNPIAFNQDLGFTGKSNKAASAASSSIKLEDPDGGDGKPTDNTGDVKISNAVYDASAKTVVCDTENIPDGDVKDNIAFDNPYDVTITSATVASNKLTIQLDKAFTETEKKKTVKITYTGSDSKTASTSFDIPAENGGNGINLQYRVQSVIGGFYRLMLPKIDANKYDAKAKDDGIAFTMDDSYFDLDLLNSNWTSFVTLIRKLNDKSDQYGYFVREILNDDKAFDITYDPKDVKYFQNNRQLIRGFKFKVVYKNYVVGQTNTYIFKVSRDSNINAFRIDSLITDKTNFKD